MAATRKRIPAKMRRQVYEKYDGHCGYCGQKIEYKDMQVDHISAVRLHEAELKAGQREEINSIENYMPACRACNYYKSTMDIERFREQLEGMTARLEKGFLYRLAKQYKTIEEHPLPIQFYFEHYGKE